MKKSANNFELFCRRDVAKRQTALRTCLTSRYPRERYILTDKLSTRHKMKDICPLFEACGVNCFDFCPMHAQDKNTFAKHKRLHACETAMTCPPNAGCPALGGHAILSRCFLVDCAVR